MNVLVTGGAGVIGSFVVLELVSQGLRPVVFDVRSNAHRLQDISANISYAVGDILDGDTVLRALKDHRIDCVVHLAALGGFAEAEPSAVARINCVGVTSVLEAAARAGGVPRVVFASSKAAYGPATGRFAHPTYEPVPESHPLQPDGIYGATKLFGEQVGLVCRARFGLEFIALRLTSVFGPGTIAGQVLPGGMIATMVENALRRKGTRLLNVAGGRNDVVYVRDVAKAVAKACTASSLGHCVFNIGSGRTTSLAEVAVALQKMFPAAVFDLGPGLAFSGALLDITLSRRELGFEPEYDIQRAITDYVDTLQGNLGPTPA